MTVAKRVISKNIFKTGSNLAKICHKGLNSEIGHAEHLALLGPAAPPLAQINPGQQQVVPLNQDGHAQAALGAVGSTGGAPGLPQIASTASEVAESSLGATAVVRRQATIALDATSINLVVSIGNMVICEGQ